MNESKIKELLTELALINNKYESIAKATGNNYNIFQVLRIETKEVITHSRMIGDLLNPKGSHGMGSQFLRLFLDLEPMKNTPKPSNLERVVCTVEKNYGPIDHDNTKGGNIDIILEGLDKPLVIENKIYARDQENQLLRYYNQLNGNCDLFYLTLFGEEPTGKSTGGRNLNITCISYNAHILEWLKNCHELTIDRPLLRETLKQYINIVKYLTGQSMNDHKNTEIFDFIEENKDSLGELHIHMNSFVDNHLKKRIQETFKEVSKDKLLIASLAKLPALFPWEGQWVYNFEFGNEEGKVVIFELKTSPERLSLFTTAYIPGEAYRPDEESDLKTKVGSRYHNTLDSRESTKVLAKQVIDGIKATKKYYDTL